MRRALALLGFVIVLALAAALLWRVFVHHMDAEPYVDDPAVVRLDAIDRIRLDATDRIGLDATGAPSVNIAIGHG